MTISRRTFLSSLVAVLGVASIPDLQMRILELGRPILLRPSRQDRTLHVYRSGLLTLGPIDGDAAVRPTWLEVLREEGVDVNSAAALAKVVVQRGMTVEELLSPVSDQCWPDVWETTWSPPERAERLLKQLKVGSALRSSEPTAGRLHFHCGDNHPGSSDVWVEVDDDLSATLLQARLVELGQPIAVIMETPSVQRDEDGWR